MFLTISPSSTTHFICKAAKLFPPIVSAQRAAALVERGHGFVGGPCLYLHEECSRMRALGTAFVGGVYILPGRRSTQHVVHLLQLGIDARADSSIDVANVGAGVAGETQGRRALLYVQDVAAGRTEEEHGSTRDIGGANSGTFGSD